MKTYEEIKDFVIHNKQNFVLGICFVVVFVVGFGAGRFERRIRRDNFKPLINYTTQTTKNPVVEEPAVTIKTAASSTTTSGICVVKGNISSTGRKLYHVEGGAFYSKTKPEQCFNTEAEALAAGFVKSQR